MAGNVQAKGPLAARAKTWLLVLSGVIVVGGIGFALLGQSPHLTQQQRISHIESEVKCPSCDGISALDSNTAGANAVRTFVANSVKAGKSDQQILNSLQASYGPTILMSPPAAYGGTLIEALPFAFVAVVLGLIGFLGYKRVRRGNALERSEGEDATALLNPSDAGVPEEVSDSSKEPEILSRAAAGSVSADAGEPILGTPGKGPRSLRSIRQSWALYLGVALLLGGVGTGIWLIRSEQSAKSQLAAEAVQARNEAQTILQARALANKGQDVQALKLLSSVLDVDPNQPVALAYQGWLLRQAGEKDKSSALINQGQQLLEKAVKLDPGYPDARVFLGYILLQDRHDVQAAITQFNAFLADNPSPSFINATKSVLVSAYKQADLAVPSKLG